MTNDRRLLCNYLLGFNNETLINQMEGYDLIVTSQKVSFTLERWIVHIEWVDYKGAH